MVLGLAMFLLLIATTSFAKDNTGSISGKVVDEQNNPLPGVNILLSRASEKTIFKTEVTNEKGEFLLDDVANGNYTLKATMSGMEAYTSANIEITGIAMSLGVIQLRAKNEGLKEVTVTSQKPMIEVKADRIVLNVENSIISAGSSALEILARAPGVRVDQSDNISLKGRSGVTIMIDGKIQPMSGDDLASALKSMPANTIDKIEIISNPGARYDAAGTGGIINIKTKKDQRIGANGSVNIAYGQGVYPKLNTGFNLNYRNRKVSVYVNYSYAYRIWFNHLMLNRKFLDTSKANYDKLLFRYQQDNNAVFDFRNHIASAGADYKLSSKTNVGIAVNGSINNFDPKADNVSQALGPDDELLYNFNTSGRHHNRYYNYSANANIKHTIDTNGKEITADLDYASFGNHSAQNFVTTYTNADGSQYMPNYYLKSDLTGNTQIRSFKADYTNPMKHDARLEAGIKASFVTSDNEPLFYELVNNNYELDNKRSNHFVYNENINAAYINASKDWKKISTQLGVRGEQTNAEWEQKATTQKYSTSYIKLFPSIAAQYHVDAKNDVGITLSRRIERPNYQQLNPFKYFIDKTTYREGYPYLLPGSCYMMELSHTFNQKLITTFTYAETKNIITEVIQPSDNEDSVTVQTNKNLDKMKFVGLSGAYNFQVTKWWSNVTNVNIYYAVYEGNIANTPLKAGKPTFDVYCNNSFVLPKDFSAELGGTYQARQLYGYMDVKPNWMLNAGIQKNILEKKATIKLNVQDIFWKGYPRATSTYTGYQEDFVAERETRQITLAFVYRFGKRTVPATRKREGGASEEIRRAG